MRQLTLSGPRETNRRACRHGLVNHWTDHTIHVANIHPLKCTATTTVSRNTAIQYSMYTHFSAQYTPLKPVNQIPCQIPGDGITQSEQTSAKSFNSNHNAATLRKVTTSDNTRIIYCRLYKRLLYKSILTPRQRQATYRPYNTRAIH